MRHRPAATLALAVITCATGLAVAQDDSVLRESVGARAAALSEMELQPFDHTLWSKLDSWTNSPGLDRAATDGKVVLIASWSTWSPPAKRIVGTLKTLHEKHADDGLVIVGVHHPMGWDAAADTLAQRRTDFIIAHDADGEFREALKIDQDPDFYLVDRAGQLRFADIRTESVVAATELLLAEEAGSAATIRDRLAEEAARRDAEARRPRTVQDRVNLSSLPEVPFTPPAATLYQLVDWPERRVEERNRNQRDQGPTTMGVPGSGWVNGAQPKTDGRAVVYYSWEFDDPRGVDLTEQMDLLQRQVGRDAVVVGVLTGIHGRDNRNNRDNQIDPAALGRRLQRYIDVHGIKHPMLVDIGGSLLSGGNRSSSRDQGYVAAVVSSDNTVRWQGSAYDDGFLSALNRVIDIDPGILARRAAEAAYIKRTGG